MRIQPVSAARLLIAASVLALAACGGGGGGSSGGPSVPTATLALTPANAQKIAGDAIAAGFQAADQGQSMGLVKLQGAQTPPRAHLLTQFLERQVALASQQSPGIIAGVVTQTACQVSGTLTEDVGATSIVRTFHACSDVVGITVNGSVAISGISATATSFQASISTNLTFSVTNFPDITFSGSFFFSETGIGSNLVTITISGAELFLLDGPDTQRLGPFTLSVTTNITTSDTTDSLTFTFASTGIGGSVTITTLTPFVTTPGRDHPHSGVLEITGANGSKIRVTVNGDELSATPQVTIQLDANGDGTFELTLNRDWSAL